MGLVNTSIRGASVRDSTACMFLVLYKCCGANQIIDTRDARNADTCGFLTSPGELHLVMLGCIRVSGEVMGEPAESLSSAAG